MGQNEHGQKAQPGQRVVLRAARVAELRDGRRQAVGGALEPEQMQEQKADKDDRYDPRVQPVERCASAIGRHREQGQRHEQNEGAFAGHQQKSGGPAEHVPGLPISKSDSLPVAREHDGPQRHGQNRRVKIRCRYRECRYADHEQDGHNSLRRTHNGAAQPEHAPIRHDHANLRKRVDSEQPADAIGGLSEPERERRADVAVELKFVAYRQHLRQIAGRRGVEQHGHRKPQRGLRQRRYPEDNRRTRADRFKVKGNVEHRAQRVRDTGSPAGSVRGWTAIQLKPHA